jgi:uncharacterized damage-inducible protein DinB
MMPAARDGAARKPRLKMSELKEILSGDGYAARPACILEGLTAEQAHRLLAGSPRTIYQELWHIAFWQKISLDWIDGIERPYPAHAEEGFPFSARVDATDTRETDFHESDTRQNWVALCRRFLKDNAQAAALAQDERGLEQNIRCPSRPGRPVRVMTVREQLENLAAHNAYHLGRIVLLRQLIEAWPPPSGGYTW